MSDKPFHLLTPAERTALRIEQNRAISEKIAKAPPAAPKNQRPPERSSGEGTRATPEERAKRGTALIRKV